MMRSEDEDEMGAVEGEVESVGVEKPGMGRLGGWELEGRREERKASSSVLGGWEVVVDGVVSEGGVSGIEGGGGMELLDGPRYGDEDVGAEGSLEEDHSRPIVGGRGDLKDLGVMV